MPSIIDRGRGPEIEGTRITVYDIMDYYKQDWHHTRIANWLRLSSDEVLCAIEYIEAHKEEVLANYQIILDRCARGNPPELQAKIDAIVAKSGARVRLRELQARKNGASHEGAAGGHQCEGAPRHPADHPDQCGMAGNLADTGS